MTPVAPAFVPGSEHVSVTFDPALSCQLQAVLPAGGSWAEGHGPVGSPLSAPFRPGLSIQLAAHTHSLLNKN